MKYESVRNEALKLKEEEGVSIYIALSHSGYEIDKENAKHDTEIDLVIGGHSHTFLYPDLREAPSLERPEGNYPSYVTQNTGSKVVPVVTDYCLSKILGHLTLVFDENGDLKVPVEGLGVQFALPILLDSSVKKNEMIEANLNEYRVELEEYTQPIAFIYDSLANIPLEESNLGNLIADSMVNSWNESYIALMNSGVSSISSGCVTKEDVIALLPFGNTLVRVNLNGWEIKDILSRSIVNTVKSKSHFIHVSGLKITYEHQGNSSFTLQEDKTICEGNVSYCDLVDFDSYNGVLPNYLAVF